MSARRNRRRSGYSMLELLVVVAALIVLGGVLVPTLGGFTRDTHTKAAGDLLLGRVSDARASAIGGGKPYRLAVSTDGSRVRVAPDDQAFTEPASEGDDAPFTADDELPGHVRATPVVGEESPMEEAGWVRVATFLPDGTCREDAAELELREPDVYPIRLQIRGLTGAAVVAPVAGGAK